MAVRIAAVLKAPCGVRSRVIDEELRTCSGCCADGVSGKVGMSACAFGAEEGCELSWKRVELCVAVPSCRAYGYALGTMHSSGTRKCGCGLRPIWHWRMRDVKGRVGRLRFAVCGAWCT